MAVPPIVALKAAGTAQKAATGDIYARRWTEVRGKGKKQRVIEHEAHFNPLVAIIGLGAAATAGVAALWLAQLKLTPVRHQTYRTVIDTPAVPAHKVIDQDAHTVWGIVIAPVFHPAVRYRENPGELPPRWGLEPEWTEPAVYGELTVSEVSHIEPAVAAVTHQEPTGKTTLRFAIEQRQPFSIADVLPNPVKDFKEATGLDKPIFGEWSKGKIFARKWKW